MRSIVSQTRIAQIEHEQRLVTIRVYDEHAILGRMDAWEAFYQRTGSSCPSLDPRWLLILSRGLGQRPYCVEAKTDDECVGILPLAHVKSIIFGSHLVSLPYLNTGGVNALTSEIGSALVTEAAYLADLLRVRHLQVRHEQCLQHDQLNHVLCSKVHMRLTLPSNLSDLWDRFKPKVRNQVRNAKKKGVQVRWGRDDLLDDFYAVFTRNMRDLGTPVFPKKLFGSILEHLSERSEICICSLDNAPIAAALLIHGNGTTEVPSAGSLRPYNWTNANMLMYWELLQRAVERGQNCFDFGRSSPDSPTYRFKKQWGSMPEQAHWQYYVRRGNVEETRIESGRYDNFVRMWQRLPLCIANSIGPTIVRGIP